MRLFLRKRILSLAAAAAVAAVCVTGCSNNSTNSGGVTIDPTDSTYAVTLANTGTGASGAGNYRADTTVTIKAGTKAEQEFKNWTVTSGGVTLADSTAATTTFPMPANAVAISAVFEAVPTTFTLTINVNPLGAGKVTLDPDKARYEPTDTVTVTLTPANGGYTFDKWTGASTSTNPVVKIPMNGNKTLTAEVIVPMFTDTRPGGKTYRTVEIGGKTWMAENLNYNVNNGSWCYDDQSENCEKYGRLYNYNTVKATTICPAGWHVAQKAEWDSLIRATGDSVSVAGRKLKSTAGWNSNSGGTDDFGFTALPGGIRAQGGSYMSAGNRGNWWTSDRVIDPADETEKPVMFYMLGTTNLGVDSVVRNGYGSELEDMGFSVRCVQD
jgi:uncharacterized protein (TIGR02145 family)/uncharacterized repeat protein (TIGR02543 family)